MISLSFPPFCYLNRMSFSECALFFICNFFLYFRFLLSLLFSTFNIYLFFLYCCLLPTPNSPHLLLSSFVNLLIIFPPCFPPDPSPIPSQSSIDHAVIGGVVAVIAFLLFCLLIVLGRYLIRHKGKHLHSGFTAPSSHNSHIMCFIYFKMREKVT